MVANKLFLLDGISKFVLFISNFPIPIPSSAIKKNIPNPIITSWTFPTFLTPKIFNKKTKSRNYTLETINKNIYIFGIAMDQKEKEEVINEANKIYDVQKVFPSIYLATELSRNKL